MASVSGMCLGNAGIWKCEILLWIVWNSMSGEALIIYVHPRMDSLLDLGSIRL